MVHCVLEAKDDECFETESENVVVAATVIGIEEEVAVVEYRVIVNFVVVVLCA